MRLPARSMVQLPAPRDTGHRVKAGPVAIYYSAKDSKVTVSHRDRKAQGCSAPIFTMPMRISGDSEAGCASRSKVGSGGRLSSRAQWRQSPADEKGSLVRRAAPLTRHVGPVLTTGSAVHIG